MKQMKLKYGFRASLFLLALWLVGGCEKEIGTYSGVDGIYFGVRQKKSLTTWSQELYDSTFFSYTYIPLERRDTVLQIRLDVQGQRSGSARPVAWQISDSSTAQAGVDYELLSEQLLVPSDSTHTYLRLRLLRPESLKNERKVIMLELLANECFRLSYPWYVYANSDKKTTLTRHHVVFDERMLNWPGDDMVVSVTEGYFGKFSRTKIDFMCSEEVGLGLEPLHFNDRVYMGFGRMMFIGQTVKRKLGELKAVGTPVMDGDEEMKMGKNIK